jgi:arylsulfatase A-like enzyme
MTGLPRPALFIGVLLGLASACDAPQPDPRTNVVLITIDTLRADRLGAYGHADARTPNIDMLAREGVVFEQASSPVPRTTAAVSSLFTSLHPHEHGAVEVGEELARDGAATLAEVLRDAGWATAGISSNGVASALQGLDRGFETFVGIRDLQARHRIRPNWRPAQAGEKERADAVTDEALDWLDGRRGPFFLWLLHLEPHFPYEPPPRFIDGERAQDFWLYRESRRWRPRLGTLYFNLNGRSADARPRASQLYDGEVAAVDAALGRLLDALDRRGDAARTLVVVTADHGESLGEHGYFFEHGAFPYEATLRIPLIFRGPGISQGRRISGPVSLLDVAPSVAALVGVDWSDPSGVDLSARLRGSEPGLVAGADGRVVFGESGSALRPQNPRRNSGGRRSGRVAEGREPFRYLRDGRFVAVRTSGKVALYDAERDPGLRTDVSAEHPEEVGRLTARLEELDVLATRWRSARDGRFKLIRIPDPDGLRWVLFDLLADPGETRDVSAQHPDVVERLRQPLEAWTDAALSDPRGRRAEGTAAKAETVDRLRALGYVE